ncbi:MAG TPA: hypothetical protein VGD92_05345 [Sphingobacteriaceae bacterium]
MLRNPAFSIALTSIYLLVFVVLLHQEVSLRLIMLLFSLAPCLLLWMVWTVLKHGRYTGRPLGSDREWGYQDRRNEDLGTFS